MPPLYTIEMHVKSGWVTSAYADPGPFSWPQATRMFQQASMEALDWSDPLPYRVVQVSA